MRELHLFAGVGGGILAGDLLGHTTVCAVEVDPYCQSVLRARQADGSLPEFPIHSDIESFDPAPWRGQVDVVCGGFPCQPFSEAGHALRGKGVEDHRYLWPEMFRVVREIRPTYVFAENVNIQAFVEPLRDLRGVGYTVPPAIQLSPTDIGGTQSRDRWWFFAALPHNERQRVVPVDAQVGWSPKASVRRWEEATWWGEAEIPVYPDGLANRVERVRATGNGQHAAVAATAFRLLRAAAEVE